MFNDCCWVLKQGKSLLESFSIFFLKHSNILWNGGKLNSTKKWNFNENESAFGDGSRNNFFCHFYQPFTVLRLNLPRQQYVSKVKKVIFNFFNVSQWPSVASNMRTFVVWMGWMEGRTLGILIQICFSKLYFYMETIFEKFHNFDIS